VANKASAGPIVLMEQDGATTLLQTLAQLALIAVRTTTVSETASGTDHLLLSFLRSSSLNQ